MDNIRDDDINPFLKGLESTTVNNVSLAITLIKEYQDALLVSEPFGDRNYYTSLVQVFIKLALKDKERVKKLATYDAAKTIKLGYTTWWKDNKAGDLRYATELANTTIKIREQCTFIEYVTYDLGHEGSVTLPKPHWRSVKDPMTVSPFDLVILDDQSQLSRDMLGRVYEGETVLDGLKAVPAIVINYVNDKAFNKKAEQISYVAIDVASIAFGVGELTLVVKLLSNSRKIYIALDILNATANIAVNTSDLQKDPTVQKWLGYYNAATLFTNFASIYTSGRNVAKGAGKVAKLGEKLNVSDFATSAKNSVKDGMTPDHIPSFAALKKNLENKLGRQLDDVEPLEMKVQVYYMKLLYINSFLEHMVGGIQYHR